MRVPLFTSAGSIGKPKTPNHVVLRSTCLKTTCQDFRFSHTDRSAVNIIESHCIANLNFPILSTIPQSWRPS